MNQAEVAKLMSELRFAIRPRHRNLKNANGPEGRMTKLRKTVTALVKHERIELFYNRADEARGYAELLISEAIRHGDRHKGTMELADFWLLEKQLVHKLFKVLAPRFENYKVSFTRMYKAPRDYPGIYRAKSVLELRGNPYPSLLPDFIQNRNYIQNVLLDEARKDYRREKLAEIAKKMASESAEATKEESTVATKEESTEAIKEEPTETTKEELTAATQGEPTEAKLLTEEIQK